MLFLPEPPEEERPFDLKNLKDNEEDEEDEEDEKDPNPPAHSSQMLDSIYQLQNQQEWYSEHKYEERLPDVI